MTPPPRVALGGIFVECNQFGGEPADRARFEQYEMRRGSTVLQQDQGAVGGMLDVLRGQDLIRAVQTMMSGLRKAG